MRFMLKLTLNRPTYEEIMALIPTKQRRGRELSEEDIRESIYVAADRSAVWTVWNCDSEDFLKS